MFVRRLWTISESGGHRWMQNTPVAARIQQSENGIGKVLDAALDNNREAVAVLPVLGMVAGATSVILNEPQSALPGWK
jgi:hypothetical protein